MVPRFGQELGVASRQPCKAEACANHGHACAQAQREIADLRGVLGDLAAKVEELEGAVAEAASTRATLKAAFARMAGPMLPGAGGAADAAGSGSGSASAAASGAGVTMACMGRACACGPCIHCKAPCLCPPECQGQLLACTWQELRLQQRMAAPAG